MNIDLKVVAPARRARRGWVCLFGTVPEDGDSPGAAPAKENGMGEMNEALWNGSSGEARLQYIRDACESFVTLTTADVEALSFAEAIQLIAWDHIGSLRRRVRALEDNVRLLTLG